MLRIDNITYQIGPRTLLNRATTAINPGHRVGLVGRNGSGKTTLLRLITGELDADGGSAETPTAWRIGVSTQEAPGGPQSLIDTVLKGDAELAELMTEAETATDAHRIAEIHNRLHDKGAHSAPARAARILAGLGFSEDAQQRPCDDFSGGWRMRVALASLLFSQPDLLLLDEPTNHLDLEARLWLEEYLRRYKGTVLLVSHDRGLLNRVVGEILHLEQGKLKLYQGGYDRFEATRRMQLELNAKAKVKQDAQRAHIQQFVDRFRYKATKAKQAQSRIKMLARMEPIPEHLDEGSITFAFPDPKPLAPPLYTADEVEIGYDGTPVLSEVSFRLDADDRIALLGANGNGKSTLIKLLADRLQPMAGRVAKSGKLRVGYFAQHQSDELDLDATPFVELARKRPDDLDHSIRAQLGRFGFSQERAETKVENLSGGEKARLLFALMTCDKPHILLLDEPTNHLDVESREALIQALNVYEGAVIIVSHDPHIIELTADRFWLIDEGRVRTYEGDLDDYRALLLGGQGNGQGNSKGNGKGNGANGNGTKLTGNKKQRRQAAAARRQDLSALKKKLSNAEKTVHRLEKERNVLRQAMADPKLYEGGGDQPAVLQYQLGTLEKDLKSAEDAWEALLEEYEQGAA